MFTYCTRLLIGCGENLREAAFGLSSAKFIRGTPGRRASLANRWSRRHSAVPVASSPVRPALCCRLRCALCSSAECSLSPSFRTNIPLLALVPCVSFSSLHLVSLTQPLNKNHGNFQDSPTHSSCSLPRWLHAEGVGGEKLRSGVKPEGKIVFFPPHFLILPPFVQLRRPTRQL